MDIRLRPHHVKRLPEYFKASGFQMFVTNFLWYGFSAALFRRKYFKKINNEDLSITVAYSISDDICILCKHRKYCHTGNKDYRKWQMRLYESIVGKHLPIKEDEKVGLKYFDVIKYKYSQKTWKKTQ